MALTSEGPGTATGASTAGQRGLAYASSFVGSTIEFYDFLIYSTAAALVFGPLFFAAATPAIGVVASFATLAVGYVARPVGGVVFGHVGDRVGRKSALITTLVLMGVATALIGLLPAYGQVGAWAPVLLIVLRLVQGVAVGGEWGGAVLMTVEHSAVRRRGLMGSATSAGSAAGSVLAFGAFALLNGLSKEQFLAWGWRLPFLATVVLLVLGLVMRLRLEETPLMKARRAQEAAPGTERARPPVIEVFAWSSGRTLIAIGVVTGPFLVQAIGSTFAVTYATTTLGIARQTMLNAIILASALQFATILFFGWLSDRVGRKAVYGTACLLIAGQVLAFFPLIGGGGAGLVVLAYFLQFTVLHAAIIGTVPALLSEQFPTRVRYTGVSLAYQGAAVLGGAVGPLVAASMVVPGGPGIAGVTALMSAAALLSLGCTLALRETRTVDLAVA